MATGYALAWAFVQIPFIILVYLHQSHETEILIACLTPAPSRPLQLFSVHVPESEKRQETNKGKRELDLLV